MAYGGEGPHYSGLTGYKANSYKGISYNNNRVESAPVVPVEDSVCYAVILMIIAVVFILAVV